MSNANQVKFHDIIPYNAATTMATSTVLRSRTSRTRTAGNHVAVTTMATSIGQHSQAHRLMIQNMSPLPC